MTIVSGVIGPTGFRFPDFNLEYQIERHVEMMLHQWPKLDRKTERRHARRLLLKGQAWLWPEPEPAQLSLFD